MPMRIQGALKIIQRAYHRKKKSNSAVDGALSFKMESESAPCLWIAIYLMGNPK